MLAPPAAFDDETRRAFADLLTEAFGPAPEDRLPRIAAAARLALHRDADGRLAAVAALKTPDATRRRDLFQQAGVPAGWDAHPLDLGWIYVRPAHRGQGLARQLCRDLLQQVPGTGVFSTTRTDNAAMRHILSALGFDPAGHPFPRRDHRLVLFLRR